MNVVKHRILSAIKVKAILNWSLASTMALCCDLPLGTKQFTRGHISKVWRERAEVMYKIIYPHAHPHHIKVVKHLICVWYWCGSHLEWVVSLNYGMAWFATTTTATGITIGATKSLANKSSSNMIRTNPSEHPHPINVVKHLINLYHWHGSHLTKWVFSLNYGTMLQFAPQEETIYEREMQRLLGRGQWYCSNHISTSSFSSYECCETPYIYVVKHLISIWHWCGSHLECNINLDYGTLLCDLPLQTTGITRIRGNKQKLGKQKELQTLEKD